MQDSYVPQVGDVKKHPKGGLWICIALNRFSAPSAWWIPESCKDEPDPDWYAQFLPHSLWENPDSPT